MDDKYALTLVDFFRLIHDPDETLEAKRIALGLFSCEITGFIGLVLGLVLHISSWGMVVLSAGILLNPLVYIVSFVITKDRMYPLPRYINAIMLTVIVSYLYFICGGPESGMVIWMVYVIVFLNLSLSGKPLHFFLTFAVVWFLGSIIYGYFNPQFIRSEATPEGMIINTCACIVVVTVVISISIFIENYNREIIDRKLQKANEELLAANEVQKRFTANINHEMRAPLNGVAGCMQMLVMNPEVPEQLRKDVERGFRSSKALLMIVNDLLDYAKIEAGEFEIIEADYDLKEIFDTVEGILMNLAQEKSLEFSIQNADDLPCGLFGDKTRIQQILTNLVSNAVKYTNKGFVRFGAVVEDDRLIITVTDSGQGISDEDKELLFVPYKRLKSQENVGVQGTGLGMSIVFNLVNQMGGGMSLLLL